MKPPPFFIEYMEKDSVEIAEVKPCCQEDNVYYYDIYIRNQYQFTVTPFTDEARGITWKIALKNADKNIESGVIEAIGEEIAKHLFSAQMDY
jgi:hypothetical protein